MGEKQVLCELDTYGLIISYTRAKCISETLLYRGAQKPVSKVYTEIRLVGITISELCAAIGVGKPAVMVAIRDLGQEVHCASLMPKFSPWKTKQPEKTSV
jgi:hypothetical protein